MRTAYHWIFTVLLVFGLACEADAATKKKKSSSKARPAATPAPQYDASGRPIIRAASAIVVDAATGRVLYEKNADAPRPPASTQKLLTALLVVENGDIDRRMVIQNSDTWAEPTKLYLKPGEIYSRRQMLEMLLVRSMNDCALALARDNAGSVERFAYRMNVRARELGATSSNFVNPNGLPAPGQFSTARDMAKIARAAYRSPTIRQIVDLQTYQFRYADGRIRAFTNTNKLLGMMEACNGMKTGYTDAAGKCLISSAKMNGRDVIAVVLGSNSAQIWRESGVLLRWGLQS